MLHQIGVGRLGPVFRGEAPDTGAPVAIKQLRLKLPPEVARRVGEGLRALIGAVPDHPAIARVVDAGLHQVDPYLVTALATGESLDVAMREYGPASIVDTLPRLERLADGLDLAAGRGVWHGGLQPRDILISAQDTQMVGLGIAQVLEHTHVRHAAHRPYAAPEIVDEKLSSAASDQYALAAIAYEWLFGGRAPRSAESVLDAPALHGVKSDALASALMRALAADPADRFASCTKFVAAIKASVTEASPGADVESASTMPSALPLPLDAFEPEGADAFRPHEHILEIGAPRLAIGDPHLDADVHPPPQLPAPERSAERPSPFVSSEADDLPRDRMERVAWQGNLGAPYEERSSSRRGRFSFGTLVMALVAGVALGGVGGYLLGASRGAPQDRGVAAIFSDQPPAATKPDPTNREFTEAPVAAPPAPPSTPEPRAAPPPPAPVANARLLVRSSPAGATVSVDGTPRGTTPLTLRELELGTRTVVISRPGFVPIERQITLTADRPSRSVEVQLTPVTPPARVARDTRSDAAVASLIVDSRPSGASVTIDGQLAGTTPLVVTPIAPGRHTVRIERPGYRPWMLTIELKAGERRRVAASLEGGQQGG